MKDVLVDLLKFSRNFGSKSLEEFRLLKEDGSKLERLYQQCLVSDDIDTLNDEYRDEGGYLKKSFMMLRRELVNKLLGGVVFRDPSTLFVPIYYREFFTVVRNSYISRILLSLGLYSAGIYLAKKTVQKALELEVWDVVITLSTVLSNYYAIRADRGNYDKYLSMVENALRDSTSDFRVRAYLNKWSLHFSKKRKADQRELKDLATDVQHSNSIAKASLSTNTIHYRYRLQIMYQDILMDYQSIIQTCEEARQRLLSLKKVPDINKLGIYHGVQMYGYLNLKEFEKAKEFAKDIDKFFTEGTLNWFIYIEYFYVLSIQTGNYQNAYDLITRVLKAQGYSGLKGVRKQSWTLMEGYMQFILLSGLWKDANNSYHIGEFKLAKFLNEVVSLGGDKTGIQVSVLILQILFLLQQGRFEDIIDRRDALRRYVYRYLYSKDNERSRLFLNMMLRMIECDFSYSLTKSKTQRLQNALSNQQMNYQANLGGNEIIDYEFLWDWVLNHIKKNWSKTVA